MAKNIVVCCDGTANEFAENRTNVVKLYSTLEQDPARQISYYHPGLGTMEPAGALSTFSRKFTRLLGMAIGYGLADDIRDAYVFLMRNFEAGDKLFLFGFSRGAYTVRAVASLLHMYGLIRPGNEPLVPYAIRMMVGISRAGDRKPAERTRYFELAREFKVAMSLSDCSPWFVGVWDTVSSIGWIDNPLKLPYVANNPDIRIGRHAVAIDEHRAFFRTHLWRPSENPEVPTGPKDVKQVWFPGVHCDVGGGYAEPESGLSKIALAWMLAEAEAAGLLVDPEKKATILGERKAGYAPPDPDAVAHESLKGAWNLAEFIFKKHYDWKTGKVKRRMNLYRRRTILPGSLVHESAFLRGGGYSKRLPPNVIPVKSGGSPGPESASGSGAGTSGAFPVAMEPAGAEPEEEGECTQAGGAPAMSAPPEAAPEIEPPAPEIEPPAEARRVLQGNLFRLSGTSAVPEHRGLTLGNRHRLDVFIGPPGEGSITADAPFADDKLDWKDSSSYQLQVIFAEPGQWEKPFEETLTLPREGRSSTCSFLFSPTRRGPFLGRVTVCHQGRILQTALLEATVAAEPDDWSTKTEWPTLRFAVEAEIRRSLGTLDQRRPFDACMVLNHAAGGKRTATAGGVKGAFIASLDGIEPQLAAINGLLSQVALDTKSYGKGLASPANARLLCDLASEGNVLYRKLVLDYIDQSPVAQALRDGEYLQILSARPDAIIPLEFVYEYPPPAKDAPVCEHAVKALTKGICPGCVPTGSPASRVCPLGFWGLRKVIERHVYDPGLPKPAKVETDTGDPLRGRDVLALRGPSLLAVSRQVPARSRIELEKCLGSAWRGGVAPIQKWVDWPATVSAKKPVLLMILPHADGAGADISLEINGDVLKSIYIDRSYVCCDPKSPPIVLLLGCDVANVAYSDAYARHIAVFRQARAALVLGTVATVLGADAAAVGGKLATMLASAAKKTPERFGEVLRRVKREAVAESLMVAMCLVAFGDADWYLK